MEGAISTQTLRLETRFQFALTMILRRTTNSILLNSEESMSHTVTIKTEIRDAAAVR